MNESEQKRSASEEPKQPHTLTIEQQKKITMSGVESVNSFSSVRIDLTVSGGKVTISGGDLKISSFSKSSGAFSATGKVSGVKYDSRGGKLAGLFR